MISKFWSFLGISMNKMTSYKVPNNLFRLFLEKACQNKKNNHFIETLAFLVGYKENDSITVTDIVSHISFRIMMISYR